jgi:DNA-binding CsgD family transcriptional regulator
MSWITKDGVTLSGGSGIKRRYNKEIYRLIDMDYKNFEIVDALGVHRNTVYRHRQIYGRLT